MKISEHGPDEQYIYKYMKEKIIFLIDGQRTNEIK